MGSSSLARDWTPASALGVWSLSLDHQGSPCESASVLYVSSSLSFKILHIRDVIQCFSFPDHSVWQSLGPSILLQKTWFCSFAGGVIFHCICEWHLDPFICWWAFRLLPCLLYFKHSCRGGSLAWYHNCLVTCRFLEGFLKNVSSVPAYCCPT